MFGITIAKKPKNYKVIDELMSRSAMLTSEKNVKWLKKHGVTTVVNLRQSGHLQNGGRERTIVEKYGMKYIHIPMMARHLREDQVDHFLDIVEGVKKEGGKLHFHCRHGSDRTGAMTWIYKQKHGIGEMSENEREMFTLGHNNLELPSMINWIKDYLYKDWGGRKGL